MAENSEKRNNTARLTRNVSKLAFRGKEKMLRSLGVGEETKDEIIDNYAHLVTKQQAQFNKFQRDMKVYLQSITAMQYAATNFYDSLDEVFEDAWMGKDMLSSLSKTTHVLHSDLHARLNAEVITALHDHLTKCNEMKLKVQKRGRKLVDFDAARRNLHTFESAKKPEESKLMKAREQVQQTHETYETMNGQLHQDLPDLHDSRVTLCTDVISSIASAEHAFYLELAEIRTKLLHVLANVRDAYDGGEYRIQRLHSHATLKSDGTHRSTLPAEDAIGPRSSGNLRTTGYSSEDKHERSGSTHEVAAELPVEPRRKKSGIKKNDYVNIEIGNAPRRPPEPVHVNGHDTTAGEDDIYTDVACDENQEDRESQSTDDVVPPPQSVVDASKPTPRPRAHTQESEKSLDKNKDVSTERSAPLPKQRTVLTPEPVQRSVGVEDSQALAEALDHRHEVSVKSDPGNDESENKRISWAGSGSIGKWMSTLTRSSKMKPEKEEDTPKKQKTGLFKIAKKKKKVKGDEESDISTMFLPNNPVELSNAHPSSEIHFKTMDSVRQHSVKDELAIEDKDETGSQHSESDAIPHVSSAEERVLENPAQHPWTASGDTSVYTQDPKNSNNRDSEINTIVETNPFLNDLENSVENTIVETNPFLNDLEKNSVDISNAVSFQDHEDTYDDVAYQPESKNDTVSEPTLVSNDFQNQAPNMSIELAANDQRLSVESQNLSVSETMSPVDSDVKLSDPAYEASSDACDSDVVHSSSSDVDLQSHVSQGGADGEEENSVQTDEGRLKHPEIIGTYPEINKENDEEIYDFALDDYKVTESNSRKMTKENDEEIYDFALDDYKVTESNSIIKDLPPDVDVSSNTTSGRVESTVNHEPAEKSPDGEVSVTLYSGEDYEFERHNENDDAASDRSSEGVYDTMLCNDTAPNSTPSHVPASSIDLEEGMEDPQCDDEMYTSVNGASQVQDVGLSSDNYGDAIYDTIDAQDPVHDDQPVYEEPPFSDAPFPREHKTNQGEKTINDINKSSSGNSSKEILPPHFLYKAVALFPYKGSDEDELSFVKGDIIYVVEFPDPDEQDEGWQMGILRSSWEDTGSTSGMAVFPENFTKRM